MYLFRLLLKLLAVPLVMVVKLVLWFGIFLTQFSGVILNLLAGLFFLIAILGYLFGLETKVDLIRNLVIGFVIFIIPHIAEWLIVKIAILENALYEFIKS